MMYFISSYISLYLRRNSNFAIRYIRIYIYKILLSMKTNKASMHLFSNLDRITV